MGQVRVGVGGNTVDLHKWHESSRQRIASLSSTSGKLNSLGLQVLRVCKFWLRALLGLEMSNDCGLCVVDLGLLRVSCSNFTRGGPGKHDQRL